MVFVTGSNNFGHSVQNHSWSRPKYFLKDRKLIHGISLEPDFYFLFSAFFLVLYLQVRLCDLHAGQPSLLGQRKTSSKFFKTHYKGGEISGGTFIFVPLKSFGKVIWFIFWKWDENENKFWDFPTFKQEFELFDLLFNLAY